MRKKRTTALLGAGCGLLCAACVLLYLQGVRGEAEAARAEALARYGGEQLEVCVAARDIAPGETVDAGALETRLWVADLLPADAVRQSAEVIGRQAASSILAGEVISLKRFEGASSSLDVPFGLEAVSVPAKDVQAVGGALASGMKVDIYATGDTSTDLLGSDVLVLATSASSASLSGDAAIAWITVAVEPSSVQELVAAAQKTQLYFVLPAEGEGAAAGGDGEDSASANPGLPAESGQALSGAAREGEEDAAAANGAAAAGGEAS